MELSKSGPTLKMFITVRALAGARNTEAEQDLVCPDYEPDNKSRPVALLVTSYPGVKQQAVRQS